MKKLFALLFVLGLAFSCTPEAQENENTTTAQELTEKDKVCPPSNPYCND